METKITFFGTSNGYLIFRLNDFFKFIVKSNNNGVINIKFLDHYRIEGLSYDIVNWFNQNSNEGLKAINFELESVCITVTAKSANRERIVRRWHRKMKEKIKESQRMEEQQRENFLKDPSYLKAEYRLQVVKSRVKSYIEQEEFEFKDETARQNWLKFLDSISDSPYSISTANYTVYWAKLMQYIIHKYEGVTAIKIAEQTAKAADLEDINDDFRYHMAAQLLYFTWKYGGEFEQLISKIKWSL